MKTTKQDPEMSYGQTFPFDNREHLSTSTARATESPFQGTLTDTPHTNIEHGIKHKDSLRAPSVPIDFTEKDQKEMSSSIVEINRELYPQHGRKDHDGVDFSCDSHSECLVSDSSARQDGMYRKDTASSMQKFVLANGLGGYKTEAISCNMPTEHLEATTTFSAGECNSAMATLFELSTCPI